MARIETLARQILETKNKLELMEQELRLLVVANCDHDWKDDSYENGHNGDYEEQYVCKSCNQRVFKDPRV